MHTYPTTATSPEETSIAEITYANIPNYSYSPILPKSNTKNLCVQDWHLHPTLLQPR